ncbi:hypothetical protein L227DRAFT_580529 [Lentinus tigrinus ALCF2SS1-6]|uniref:Homeobox domain-containing protein n=1 Tax=Lentinus tigrinus ALCF2SS1-6 TaxID=1328759 RepID=A0A5C2RRV0_9APHY|nr:hypothetical protein L227DRAFT_580529 [Lentinus tigrinus ALCF2SS1-6]
MKPSCGTCRADGLDGKCDYRATVDGRAITEEVKQALEQFYQTRNKAPTYEERLDLAKETGCRTEDIKTWFNNRRRADRSDVKTSSTPTDSKKKWKKMSKSQNNFLEDYVRRNDRPDGPQRDWIAGQLNLDTEYIHKWFDHTRQKYHRANNPS